MLCEWLAHSSWSSFIIRRNKNTRLPIISLFIEPFGLIQPFKGFPKTVLRCVMAESFESRLYDHDNDPFLSPLDC